MGIFFEALKTPTALLALGMLVWAVILAAVSGKCKKKSAKRLFRLLCLLPLIACIVHGFFLWPVGHKTLISGYMIGDEVKMLYGPYALRRFGKLYLAAAAFLLMMPAAGKGFFRRTAALIVCIAVGYCAVIQVFAQLDCYRGHNETHSGWTEAFRHSVEIMRREYVLSDWKQIDYDALEAKYLPRIEEAEQANDPVAYGKALREFSCEFHDGHLKSLNPSDLNQTVFDTLTGNDYGMSMFRLTSGETIAVLVDEDSDAYQAGIRSGTVILQWDGVPVDEAAEAVLDNPYADRRPVRENSEFFSTVMLAGQGGDTVTVTFADENGAEQTAELHANGSYTERCWLAEDCILHEGIRDPNFSTKMISDTCGYLRVDNEEYNDIPEYLSYLRGGYYPALMEELNAKFTALKEQGMQYLVIDLRNNSGGRNTVGAAVASMFTDQKMFQYAEGTQNGSSYQITKQYDIFPDGRWKDLPVAVLVNSSCVSAGDGAALFLSKCENVTLIGMTPSCGINQNTGGEIWLPGGFQIRYPAALTLGEDAKPMIDTDASRENRIPLDAVIPVDKKAALRIFDTEAQDDDYELEYVMDYLKGQSAAE